MLNAFYDAYRVLCKVYSDGTFVKQAIADTAIEELNRSHTVKIVYGVLDKDIELGYYISSLCDKNPKQAIRIILKEGLYAIRYLNAAPYAVVDNLVELTKKLGKSGNAGFVNAVLRKFTKTAISLPDEYFSRLSVEFSYPEWLVRTLVKDYGESRAVGIMSADEERTLVRFNDGNDGEKYLTERRWNFEKTPFENAYFVKGFKRDADFDKGIYTFQSIGSIAIGNIVGAGECLFDACAAPGGKSVFLASKFKTIVSAELHAHRVALIESYASRMGKKNIVAVQNDSSKYNENYRDNFDKVLADVPCSGTGVLKDNPDIKLRRVAADIDELNATQYAILSACSEYVKIGGELIYSTCSVLKDENQKIIMRFLKEHDNFEEVKITSALKGERIDCGLNFFPDISFGAGFFVCKLKRVK